MFQCLKNVLNKKRNELGISQGLLEHSILSLTEDYFKQNDFFLCFPKSFKNGELLIICSKPIIAQDLNENKDKIIDFLKTECPEIIINSILIKVGYL